MSKQPRNNSKTTNKLFDWSYLVPRTEAEKEKLIWALVITCCVPLVAQQADASPSVKVQAEKLPLQIVVN